MHFPPSQWEILDKQGMLEQTFNFSTWREGKGRSISGNSRDPEQQGVYKEAK